MGEATENVVLRAAVVVLSALVLLQLANWGLTGARAGEHGNQSQGNNDNREDSEGVPGLIADLREEMNTRFDVLEQDLANRFQHLHERLDEDRAAAKAEHDRIEQTIADFESRWVSFRDDEWQPTQEQATAERAAIQQALDEFASQWATFRDDTWQPTQDQATLERDAIQDVVTAVESDLSDFRSSWTTFRDEDWEPAQEQATETRGEVRETVQQLADADIGQAVQDFRERWENEVPSDPLDVTITGCTNLQAGVDAALASSATLEGVGTANLGADFFGNGLHVDGAGAISGAGSLTTQGTTASGPTACLEGWTFSGDDAAADPDLATAAEQIRDSLKTEVDARASTLQGATSVTEALVAPVEAVEPNLNPADISKYAHGPFTLPVPNQDVPSNFPILGPLRETYHTDGLFERPTSKDMHSLKDKFFPDTPEVMDSDRAQELLEKFEAYLD